MKQTTKRFLSMIISFLLFTGALIVYFNLVVPANNEEQAIKAEVISRQSFINSQKEAISQVQKLINSYKGEGEIQDVVSSILPQSPDLAGSFSQISGLAQINKLAIDRVTVGIPVNQNASVAGGAGSAAQPFIRQISSVDFQVKFAGTYEDFKSFLKNIETNIRIFDVKKIDMQQSAGKPNQNQNQNNYSFDVTITTYYQSSS